MVTHKGDFQFTLRIVIKRCEYEVKESIMRRWRAFLFSKGMETLTTAYLLSTILLLIARVRVLPKPKGFCSSVGRAIEWKSMMIIYNQKSVVGNEEKRLKPIESKQYGVKWCRKHPWFDWIETITM